MGCVGGAMKMGCAGGAMVISLLSQVQILG